MGVGPIPRSTIRAYARDVLELDGEAHDRFCEIIARVDSDYVAMANETKSESKQRSVVPIDDADGVKKLFDRFEQAPSKPKVKKPPQ